MCFRTSALYLGDIVSSESTVQKYTNAKYATNYATERHLLPALRAGWNKKAERCLSNLSWKCLPLVFHCCVPALNDLRNFPSVDFRLQVKLSEWGDFQI
jgi:hypothetical protein